MQNLKTSKRGSALLLILSICIVLAVLTAAVGVGTVSNLKSVSGDAQDEQTRFIAAAGIQSALARLSEVRAWPTSGSPYGQGSAWSLADYNYDFDHLGLWSTTNDKVHAQVLAYNNTDGAFYRSSVGPDGTPIPDGKVLIVSKGLVEGDTRGARQSTTLMALAKPVGVTFDSAVAASGQVNVLDTIVDAVDSSVAGWTPALYTPYDMSVTPTQAAKISSNSISTDTIKFDGTSKVDGSIFSGPSSPLGAIGYYGATITGTDGTLSSIKDMNNPLPADTDPELNGGGNVSYAGGAPSVIAAGTYRVSGNLTLTAGANLTVTGPTVLYVEGDFSADGATLNMTGKPSDLQIFVVGGGSSAVDLSNTQASILLSSPESVATVTSSELFGAVIGSEVNLQSTKLHYDQAVRNLVLGSSAWTMDGYVGGVSTEDPSIVSPPGGPPSDPYATSGGSGTTTGGTTGSTTGSSTGGTTSGSSSGGTTSSSSGSSSGSSTGPGRVRGAPKCCLDYACGPPKCIIY